MKDELKNILFDYSNIDEHTDKKCIHERYFDVVIEKITALCSRQELDEGEVTNVVWTAVLKSWKSGMSESDLALKITPAIAKAIVAHFSAPAVKWPEERECPDHEDNSGGVDCLVCVQNDWFNHGIELCRSAAEGGK